MEAVTMVLVFLLAIVVSRILARLLPVPLPILQIGIGAALSYGIGFNVRLDPGIFWIGEEPGTPIRISILIPFAAYLAADHLHLSGILAAAAAGISMHYADLVGHSSAVTRIRIIRAQRACTGHGLSPRPVSSLPATGRSGSALAAGTPTDRKAAATHAIAPRTSRNSAPA